MALKWLDYSDHSLLMSGNVEVERLVGMVIHAEGRRFIACDPLKRDSSGGALVLGTFPSLEQAKKFLEKEKADGPQVV